ncbi:MAG: SRPBCC domain-containing protein [Acidimicrobiia bacterium]
MTRYAVQRTIEADPQTIWNLLTEASAYPDWNPAVLGIEGTIAPGERIKLTSVVNPGRQFKLTVSEFDPPTHMVWSDGMPFGLFKGVRTYEVAANDDGTSSFSMEEVFSGLMEPLIAKSLPDMTESFEQFGDGLKAAAESR